MTSKRTRDRLVSRLRTDGISDERVLSAMGAVPRHVFVDEALASRAYEDTALPIGNAQTISQPYVVARMTQALIEGKESVGRVLEVGTGCGYQTAVLARVVDRVYSIERIESLLFKAREHLHLLSINNVRTRHGDGYAGWEEQGPFDGILVAAAPANLPEQLLGQLADRARMVIPVGDAGDQDLVLLERNGNEYERRVLERVSFVPLVKGLT